MASAAFDSTLAGLGIQRATSGQKVLPASAANPTLGQADFLKLMTAQLKNQDPFSPVDNTQMIAQMAQFSSVAGISEMNTTLKAIADKLATTSPADALGYVGKTVLTAGNTAFGRTSGGLAGAIELSDATTQTSVTITGANGAVLKTLALGAQKKGTVEFDWDGKTENGEDAGSGPFNVAVSARNGNAAVGATSLVWAPVQSVAMPAKGTAILSLPGLGQVPVTAVRQIG